MTLQEQIKADLKSAMKARDDDKKSTIRVILGEFSRAEKKELSDDEVIKVLQKLIKSEKEVLEKKGEDSSSFIEIIATYLPQMATDDEIVAWIQENIDFAQFKNEMQAMGPIMKHFGALADGNRVKELLQNM
ncbi:MAG: GatB/YqeY domain-containing protein [Desulfobacterales bacterium]